MNERETLYTYVLHLADNSLILGHRNSEWCGHGPVLEQDIAITNISLDLIGQARSYYQYAAQIRESLEPGCGATEDTLAYLRKEREYLNVLLVEQPNGDWAQTILRQFLFSSFQYLSLEKLLESRDEMLRAIAAKAIKEVSYHKRWSREWVIRLGDGTEESHRRLVDAVSNLWTYGGELTDSAPYEKALAETGIAVDVSGLRERWMQDILQVFDEAGIPMPPNAYFQVGGKQGRHTEHLGYILTDLQYMQRTYPGCEW